MTWQKAVTVVGVYTAGAIVGALVVRVATRNPLVTLVASTAVGIAAVRYHG